MVSRRWFDPSRGWVVGLVALLAAGLNLAPAPAAQPDSLKLVPANAAFYTSMLRGREQVEIVGKSQAWARLMALPVVRDAWEKVKEQYNSPRGEMAMVRLFLQLPENEQLLELLADMASNEVFFYGGQDWASAVELFGQLGFAPYSAALSRDGPEDLSQNDRITYKVLQTLAGNLELIKIPDMVFGFKLSENGKADFQLRRLEVILGGLVEQVPELKGRLKKAKTAAGTFLTMNLDGEMVPWKEIRFDRFENKPGEYDKLIEKLRSLKLTLSIAIRDSYLLVSIGGAADPASGLGQGPPLADRPEFKPLAAHADRKLTSIGYVSKEFISRAAVSDEDVDSMMAAAGDALKMVPLLTPDQVQRIRKDLDGIGKDIKSLLPRPGAMLSFSFLNERGIEGYAYDWSQSNELDASQPLTILNHVGGNPILAIASRARYQPERYDMLVRWLKLGYGYFEEIALPLLPEDNRDRFKTFADAMLPILRKINDVTAQTLLPSMADGQSALVLDGKLTSNQWVLPMPPSDKALPLPELALVLGLSDAGKFERAWTEYRSLLNAMIAQASRIEPMQVPPFQIPAPQSKKLAAGTMYYYPLPDGVPVDKQLLPNAGVGEKFAVLSLSEEHTGRLLTPKPLTIDGGPLANLGKPRSMAVYFHFAGLVDALDPWVDYGVKAAMISPRGGADPQFRKEVEAVLSQVREAMLIIKALRTISSSTAAEMGVTVTHNEVVFKDLPGN